MRTKVGSSWDALHAQYKMKRINHVEAYSLDGACTNWTEEFSSRMPALTNCARRISNLSGGCMIFRPPLADLIPEIRALFREPGKEFSKNPEDWIVFHV